MHPKSMLDFQGQLSLMQLALFLNEKDSLIRGKGDLIANVIFPKYYFLIIKPSFKCSTISMQHTAS